MIEVRCHKCDRFIGKADSQAMLKCPSHGWQVVKIVDTGRVVTLPLIKTRVSVG